jgi:hypothetical protein
MIIKFFLGIISLTLMCLADCHSQTQWGGHLRGAAQFNRSTQMDLDSGLAQGDPLVSTWAVWNRLANSGDREQAKRDVAKIISNWNLFETRKLTYKYQYKALAPGWWSSMDSLFFPLLLLQVYDLGDREIELAREMIEISLRSPLVGGSLWPDEGKGCFFSEYSWPGMTSEDEYYVMNGHLFSLTALKLISNIIPEKKFSTAVECSIKGTRLLSDRFIHRNHWPLYQLVPKTINMPHYVIFEIVQFTDLWDLTGDQFFFDQKLAREHALERQYPVYLVSSANRRFLFFSGVGAPHPYEPDLFLSSVSCVDEKSRTVHLRAINKEGLPKSRFLKSDSIHSNIKRCDVYSSLGNGQITRIFSTSVIKEIEDKPALEMKFSSEGMFDAVLHGSNSNQFLIDPSRKYSNDGESSYLDVEGRLVFSVPGVILNSDRMFSVEIDADQEVPIGVILWQNDKSVARYYRPLLNSEHNIIVVSPLGFDGADDLRAVDKIGVVVYTDKMLSPARIDVRSVKLIDNLYQFYLLLSNGGKLNYYYAKW